MSEKSILFSTEMVRAILEGRKTMTRRVIKPQPIGAPDGKYRYDGVQEGIHAIELLSGSGYPTEKYFTCVRPPFMEGDVLWVRETWADIPETAPGNFHYKASATDADLEWFTQQGWKWRPSVHMPCDAARIFLRVTGVTVERLSDMSDKDAIAEGVLTNIEYSDLSAEGKPSGVPCLQCGGTGLYTAHSMMGACPDTDCERCGTPVKRFRLIWDSLNAKRGFSWEPNPWVWVYTFERV
jgi:hypothetical protein